MSCTSSEPSTYCATTSSTSASSELKLYQAFIFSVPVFFTLLFLLLFYLLYLRRRSASWQSMRMRTSRMAGGGGGGRDPRSSGSGIKKEVREMLPVVVFKESFLIRETLCSVCLGDYKSDERLQRIPPCGHTFHLDCIDHWLATNTTCPLCRVSLLQAPKPSIDDHNHSGQARTDTRLQEQSSGSLPDQRANQQDNRTQENEPGSSALNPEHAKEAEESRHHGEQSDVAINIESNVTAEDNVMV